MQLSPPQSRSPVSVKLTREKNDLTSKLGKTSQHVTTRHNALVLVVLSTGEVSWGQARCSPEYE